MVASDTYQTEWERAYESAKNAVLITPNDNTDLAVVTRAISFGGAGAIKVDTLGGDTVVIPSGALAAGVMHPLRVTRVYSTSTTATSIVGYY